MRGLIIAEPWIDKILAGRKTWEIRGTNTKVRGRIALIRKGAGEVVGTATLVDSIGPLLLDDLKSHMRKHCVPGSMLNDVLQRYRRPHAWVLDGVHRLDKPVAYDHPAGAVIWVTLPMSEARLARRK